MSLPEGRQHTSLKIVEELGRSMVVLVVEIKGGAVKCRLEKLKVRQKTTNMCKCVRSVRG